MATPAQIAASIANSEQSTGPVTAEGKTATSRNALKFGLFSTKNCVLPGEHQEYEELSAALWTRLEPADPLEELYATEVIRSTWRLRRCASVEHYLAGWACAKQKETVDRRFKSAYPDADLADAPEAQYYDPDTYPALSELQSKIDRARAQAHTALARATAELRRLQTERAVRREVYTNDAGERRLGIAATQPVLRAMSISARRQKDEALARVEAMFAGAIEIPVAKQSQQQIALPSQIARGAQCPCKSGEKYKHCCGRNAPPVLHTRTISAAA